MKKHSDIVQSELQKFRDRGLEGTPEEIILAAKKKNWSLTRLLRSRDALFEAVRGWALRYANKKYESRGRHMDIDDMRQLAMEGALKAALRYDWRKGALTTIATWWIMQNIVRFNNEQRYIIRIPEVKKTEMRKGRVDPEETKRCENVMNVELTQFLENPGPIEETPLCSTMIKSEMRRLIGPRARQVLYLRFWEGLTLRQIGSVMGLSCERIRQIERRALKTLSYSYRMKDEY